MTEIDSQLLGEHKPPVLAQPSHSGALAQLGERRLCKPEVTGSIPVRSTRTEGLHLCGIAWCRVSLATSSERRLAPY
jgi:hypothetical protein